MSRAQSIHRLVLVVCEFVPFTIQAHQTNEHAEQWRRSNVSNIKHTWNSVWFISALKCIHIYKHNYEPAHNYYCHINGAIYFITIFCILPYVCFDCEWAGVCELCAWDLDFGHSSNTIFIFFVCYSNLICSVHAKHFKCVHEQWNNARLRNFKSHRINDQSLYSLTVYNTLAGLGWGLCVCVCSKRCDGFRCWFSHDIPSSYICNKHTINISNSTQKKEHIHSLYMHVYGFLSSSSFSSTIIIIIFILLAEICVLLTILCVNSHLKGEL